MLFLEITLIFKKLNEKNSLYILTNMKKVKFDYRKTNVGWV